MIDWFCFKCFSVLIHFRMVVAKHILYGHNTFLFIDRRPAYADLV